MLCKKIPFSGECAKHRMVVKSNAISPTNQTNSKSGDIELRAVFIEYIGR